LASVHVPTRTCLVCRARREKKRLVRLAVDRSTSQIVLDDRQWLPGRGAYVCEECVPRLSFSNRVRRAFRNRACGLSEEIVGSRTERGV
jgi:predicted RNA-binding protein YlxR (DUF448 family)